MIGMKPRLLCLHGFAGTAQDYSFLSSEFDIIAPNLDDYVGLEFSELKEKFLKNLCENQEVAVLGYSFGGRLAARLKISAPEQVKKTIICSAHMGHQTVPQARIDLEESIVSKLESMDKAEFFNFWNSLDLFKHDLTSKLPEADLETLKLYFTNYGQSKQPYLIDELQKYKHDITFVYGLKDEKYCEYANKYLSSFALEFIDAGHRVLQNEAAIQAILKVKL